MKQCKHDIRRQLINAFGTSPKALKRVLVELDQLIEDMKVEKEERYAEHLLGRGPHP